MNAFDAVEHQRRHSSLGVLVLCDKRLLDEEDGELFHRRRLPEKERERLCGKAANVLVAVAEQRLETSKVSSLDTWLSYDPS